MKMFIIVNTCEPTRYIYTAFISSDCSCFAQSKDAAISKSLVRGGRAAERTYAAL